MVTMVGKAEYDQTFCEDRLELKEGDKALLLKDHSDGMTKFACCRLPEGVERIRKSTNCIYNNEYEAPTISQRIPFFLKSFK